MKLACFIAPLFVLLSACATAPRSTEHPDTQFSWLLGSWRTEGEQRYTIETWERAADGTGSLVGGSRTMRDGQQVFAESLRIEQRTDGIYFVASPQGQATHAFALLEASPTHITFEDLSHDFPSRIRYTLESPNTLVGQIFGTQGGQERSATWRYTRLVD